MHKDWKKFGALFLIVTLVAVTCSACIGGGGEETTTPAPTTSAPITNELPSGMDADWKAYFESADFDGDGIAYIYDQYLGRDDSEVDFATMTGGTFNTMGADVKSWDPIDIDDTVSHSTVGKVLEALVQYVPGTTDPMPCLAVAWEVSDDGLEYIFYLRQNVTFSNGEVFNADDVIFSLDRLGNEIYAAKRVAFLTSYVESYEKVDDYTVKINLKYAFAPFLTLMTYSCFHILPNEYTAANETVGETVADGVQKDWLTGSDMPMLIGTGPWVLAEYIPGDTILLEANLDYWAGRPYLDALRTKITEEDDTITQAWFAGQIDVCGVTGDYWDEFQTNYADNLISNAELSSFYTVLNCSTWPFDSVAIRQAFTCGIERERVLNEIFKGRMYPAHGMLPPGIYGFSQELYDDYEWLYNPEKAKQILDDAGIVDTNGDGIREYQGRELEITLYSYESNEYNDASKVWEADLEEIGIALSFLEYDFPTLLDINEAGDFTAMTLAWIADYPDPENFFILFESSTIPDFNACRYVNPDVDAMIDQLRKSSDPDERLQLSYDIEAILQNDCPHVWFYHRRSVIAIHDWVHNYTAGAMGTYLEKRLQLWIDEEYR